MFLKIFLAAAAVIFTLVPEFGLATSSTVEATYTAHRRNFSISTKGDYEILDRKDSDRRQALSYSEEILRNLSGEFSRVFGTLLSKPMRVVFLPEEEFRRHTRAPSWAKAIYSKGEIAISIPKTGKFNLLDLRQTLRHEYLHGIIAQLSGGRCPAWLDEGLVQIFEGQSKKELSGLLRKWLAKRDAPQLGDLESALRKAMKPKLARVSYAYSLFATRSLLNSFGKGKIIDYLRALGEKQDPDTSFRRTFGISSKKFKADIRTQITRWAKSSDSSL